MVVVTMYTVSCLIQCFEQNHLGTDICNLVGQNELHSLAEIVNDMSLVFKKL
jgi:hypothetical protein